MHRNASPRHFPPDVQNAVTEGKRYDLMVSLYQVSCCFYYFRKIVIHLPWSRGQGLLQQCFCTVRTPQEWNAGGWTSWHSPTHPHQLQNPRISPGLPKTTVQKELQKDETELWTCYCTNNKENITEKTTLERKQPIEAFRKLKGAIWLNMKM